MTLLYPYIQSNLLFHLSGHKEFVCVCFFFENLDSQMTKGSYN